MAKTIKKRWKIDRLKGRVTPIYKFEESYKDFYVSKYTVEYTELDLEWSVPLSVLFLEQEYIKENEYFVKGGAEKVDDLESIYETIHAEKMLESNNKISAKTIKQQKIDNLNKVFNENYK